MNPIAAQRHCGVLPSTSAPRLARPEKQACCGTKHFLIADSLKALPLVELDSPTNTHFLASLFFVPTKPDTVHSHKFCHEGDQKGGAFEIVIGDQQNTFPAFIEGMGGDSLEFFYG